MPFSGFEDWGDCIQTMTEEEGHDMESAENICGALQAEEKSENGNPEELMAALEQGSGLIADVGVDLVSGVDVPAVDSKWVMMKSDSDHDYRVTTPVLLSKDDDAEKRIAYAAAMIPREADKEGDVAPTATVEKAAHDFLKQDGGIDTDHSLIDGEGTPVESWILKEDREFDLPGGGTETYGAGTWMLGIEWGQEAWERIKAGELTGLSIYGMAEHVPLERAAKSCNCTPTEKQPEDDPCWEGYEMVGTKIDENGNEVPNCVPKSEASASTKQLDIPLANESVVHLVYESRTAAEKASEEIGLGGDVHEHEFDGMTVWMPGDTHEAFVDRYMELSDEVSSAKSASPDNGKGEESKSEGMAPTTDGDGDGDGGGGADGPTLGEVHSSVTDMAETVDTLKEAVETEKQDEDEAAATLADAYGMSTNDVLDLLTAAADGDADSLMDTMEELGMEMAESEEEDDDEMEASTEGESVEKRTDDANLEKGHDGEGVRETEAEKNVGDGPSTGMPSYADAAEQFEAGDS